MRILVKVVPNAKKNFFDGEKIYVTAPPENGKANLAVVEVLAEHFSVRRSSVKIISGLKSRRKTVEILP